MCNTNTCQYDLVLRSGPAEISEPAFALRSGMLSALTQYLTVHVFKVLSPAEGEALIVTALVSHVCQPDTLELTLYFTPFWHAKPALLMYLLVYVLDCAQTVLECQREPTTAGMQGVASDLLGRPLDFTQPAAQLLHALSLVPMPGAPPKPRKASNTSASKPIAKPAQSSSKSELKKVK